MRFNRLDLNLLVALDAMLSLGSVSKAAEQLNLSQSAMSNALSRLRDYFGDELLVPVGRSLEPTPRALLLQDAVRDVLVRVDSAISAKPVFDPTRSDRVFRISCSDFTATTLIPHLLNRMDRNSVSVSIHLTPQVAQPDKALERGEADVLLIPRQYCSPNHPVQTMLDEHFVCGVWSGSRLAGHPLTAEDFLAAGHVVTRPHTSAQSIESVLLDRLGIQRRIEVTTFSFANLPHLLIGTERIATLHSRLALHSLVTMPLVLHPIPFDLPVMEQAMQWHQYRSTDPGISWLRSELLAAVAELDKDLMDRTGVKPGSPLTAATSAMQSA